MDCRTAGNVDGHAQAGDTVRIASASSLGAGALSVSIQQRHAHAAFGAARGECQPKPGSTASDDRDLADLSRCSHWPTLLG